MATLPQPGQTAGVSIAGVAGEIECAISMPPRASAQPVVAVVCHPHPLYGGTMDNKVAYTLARTCADAGAVALRFNFRGVGHSKGIFSGGEGETEDALAVLDWGLKNAGATQFILAGFSFGGYVSVRAAQQRKPLQLITVAPALNYFGASPWRPPGCPWLVIHGDADDVVDCAQTLDHLKAVEPPPDIHVLPGVGHFFHGRLGDLRNIIQPVLQQRFSELNGSKT